MSGRSPRWFTGIKYPYEANFADNTWEQIIAACQRRSVSDTWAVGDQKAMTINGTDYLIDIIGKDHDDYSDGTGKAPITFQMHDLYSGTYTMNSSRTTRGGWGECQMRTTHLPAILALMPSEVQNGIREVNKLTAAGYGSGTINTTADKLWLLSEIEIFGSISNSYTGEGSQYAYYAAGNSKVKQQSGSAKYWWERSPNNGNINRFCEVTSFGGASAYYADTADCLSFAFCF